MLDLIPFSIQIGNMFAACRKDRGFEQSMADIWANVDSKTLSSIESGEREPEYEHVYLLSKLYGLSITQIVHPLAVSAEKFRISDYHEPKDVKVVKELLKAKLRFLSLDEKLFLKTTLENYRNLQKNKHEYSSKKNFDKDSKDFDEQIDLSDNDNEIKKEE